MRFLYFMKERAGSLYSLSTIFLLFVLLKHLRFWFRTLTKVFLFLVHCSLQRSDMLIMPNSIQIDKNGCSKTFTNTNHLEKSSKISEGHCYSWLRFIDAHWLTVWMIEDQQVAVVYCYSIQHWIRVQYRAISSSNN